ncbi:MAG: hypothetical protein COU40_03665 [Candidatus Moranbacteria bacterium CG10_big_fil_rev_8_21_14_0_10_35_21]|nr:MAG: hypothetical protein COU40_03665 [Candidatus Moranbacteria bacterium CG10_big_fil_rev_8_21_14_0_10_35_21]PJA88790.1 MAG: hypothetical protein CO139_01300 [Candidatus Moranbacteria bacterium CG_4_9_14_3_um_filter_36_9]
MFELLLWIAFLSVVLLVASIAEIKFDFDKVKNNVSNCFIGQIIAQMRLKKTRKILKRQRYHFIN